MFERDKKEILVDAIQDGKIIRATEEYAKREGLLVLKRYEPMNPKVSGLEVQGGHVTRNERKGLLKFEEFRKPLKGDSNLANELVGNFHWVVLKRRKEKNLTRKQMATDLGVSEYDLKMFETGVLTSDDFVLVGKIERYLGINLRKDGKDYNKSPLQGLRKSIVESRSVKKEEIDLNSVHEHVSDFSGNEIDLED